MAGLTRTTWRRVALIGAALTAVFSVSIAAAHPGLAPSDSPSAQGTATAAPVVTVRGPNSLADNVTFTGVAVDCSTGQPATRVAVYDGADTSAPYMADVAMNTMVNLGTVCRGRSDSVRAGYTLIFNARALPEGFHTFLFAADFPNGATGSAIYGIDVQNIPIWENYCSDPNC